MSDDELCLRIWGVMDSVDQVRVDVINSITATDVPSPHGSDAWPRDEVHNAARKVGFDGSAFVCGAGGGDGWLNVDQHMGLHGDLGLLRHIWLLVRLS